MFQSLDVFVLSCLLLNCLLLAVETRTGLILPPENVSLQWTTDFDPLLSWAPPKHSMKNCIYEVNSLTYTSYGPNSELHKVYSPRWTAFKAMEGGFLHLSVKTVCNGTQSTPVVINVTDPELVRDLSCHIRSSKQTHCSWTPAIHAPDLSFYYQLVNEDMTTSVKNQSRSRVQACPSYTYTDDVRTGCDVQAKVIQNVHIVFNGTVNNRPVRNTFNRGLRENVKPPPLKWEVNKTGDHFLISWTPPDISVVSWKFTINYTECDVPKTLDVGLDGENKAELRLVPHCPYRMAIKATSIGGDTPWSEEKYFDADTDSKAMVYAAIIIPLMAASLAALTFVIWMKHKDKLFPKIPKPRDLLSDISDNNNKATVSNLYITAEEENCEIALVMDPQNTC